MIKLKEEKAVTLTALLVALIVIVIIGGVSLNIALGENGIFSKAKQGVSAYKEQSIREKLEVKLSDWNIELLAQNKEKTIENILNLANQDSEIKEASQNGNNILIVIDEYQLEINKNLEIIGDVTVYNQATALRKQSVPLEFCEVDR